MPKQVLMFAAISFLNEVFAQMVAPLIPILLASVLTTGPIILGLVEGLAAVVAAMLKLWAERRTDVKLLQRKPMVVRGYELATFFRPLIALAGSWVTVSALRSAGRLGKGIRVIPATPSWQTRPLQCYCQSFND